MLWKLFDSNCRSVHHGSAMLLITDTLAITCDDERRILPHAAVLIDGTRIAAVGPTRELEPAHPEAQRTDGRGLAVLPGLVNAESMQSYGG